MAKTVTKLVKMASFGHSIFVAKKVTEFHDNLNFQQLKVASFADLATATA